MHSLPLHGAFWSMLIGIASCVIWRFAVRLRVPALTDVHEIIPACLVSMFAYLLISRLTRGKVPDDEHLGRLFAGPTR